MFLNFCLTSAQETLKEKPEAKDKELRFLLSIAYLMGGSSTDLFEFYKNELSGLSKEFKLGPASSFGLIFDLTEFSSILISGEISRAYLNDNYTEIISAGHAGARNITQKFDILSIPLTVNYKFHPILSNYFSYVMFGFGVAHSHIKWEESVYSSIQEDIRKGGLHFNNDLLVPVLKFSTGIELDFDQKSQKNFLHSFFCEISFNYFFRSADIYAKAISQFYQQKVGFKKKYTILPYYFGLNFGLSFYLDFEN